MKNRYKKIGLFIIALLFSSCASLINKKTTRITISADEPVKLIVNRDTIAVDRSAKIEVPRSKDSLLLTIISRDKSACQQALASVNSLAYYFNLTPLGGYGLGFIFDSKKAKRYSYPYRLSVTNQKLFDYYHKRADFDFENMAKLCLTDFIPLDGFSKLGVNYERRIRKRLSVNSEIAVFLPGVVNDRVNGYRIEIAPRYYLHQYAPFGSYLSSFVNGISASYTRELKFINSDVLRNPLVLFPLPDNRIYAEQVDIRQQSYAFGFSYGYQKRIVNRFIFDLNVGFGFRCREINHFNRSRPGDQLNTLPFYLYGALGNYKKGKYWGLILPIRLKIGYSF